jgi:hypothetical protein
VLTRLASALARDKRLEVVVGDAHRAAEVVRDESPRLIQRRTVRTDTARSAATAATVKKRGPAPAAERLNVMAAPITFQGRQ